MSRLLFPFTPSSTICLLAFTAACGGSRSTSTGPEGEPPRTVEVFPNPYDTSLVRALDLDRNEVHFRGRKNSQGVVETIESATVRAHGLDPIEITFDAQHLPHVFQLADGSGMRVDWLPEVVHFRIFDALGAITNDVWFDRRTRTAVPAPGGSASAATGHSSPGVAVVSRPTDDPSPAGLGGDEPLIVDVALGACGDRPTVSLADVESCIVELSSDLGTYAFRAASTEEGFRAVLPRNLTPYEWRTEQCEALCRTLGRLCILSDESAVSDLLTALCTEYGAFYFGPQAALVCALANLSVSVLCANIGFLSRLSCSAAVIVSDPFGSWWHVARERRIRAVVLLRTCEGIERRISDVQVVDNGVRQAQLVVDGCLTDSISTWNLLAACSHLGAVQAGAGSPPQIWRDPNLGWTPVGWPIPVIGPHTRTDHCYWPYAANPLFDIQIHRRGTMHVRAGQHGGSMELAMSLDRTMHQLREPTPLEVQNGLMNMTPPCLTVPMLSNARLAALHVVRLRPFQRLVVELELEGESNPGAVHRLEYLRPWPQLAGYPSQHTIHGSGRATLEVTHGDLLHAYEQNLGHVPFPPGASGNGVHLASQCFHTWFIVTGDSELTVGQEVHGSTRVRMNYRVRVERN